MLAFLRRHESWTSACLVPLRVFDYTVTNRDGVFKHNEPVIEPFGFRKNAGHSQSQAKHGAEMSRHDLGAYLLKRWLPVLLGIVVVAALIYLLRDCMYVPA
jgi:hypothetical protein